MSHTFSWVPRQIGPIGVDFGARSVRMLQLASHQGQLTVIAIAQREIPPGITLPADLDHFRSQAVQDMLKTGGFRGRKVVTALSWDDLIIRNIRLPVMPEAELQEAIPLEAADRLGVDPAKTQIRLIVAGDIRQGNEVRQEIIVMAAAQSAIETQLNRLNALGLIPLAIDAAPCGLFRAFERFLRRNEDVNQVNTLVDMGHSSSRVVMARGSNITLIKTIPLGGQRFNELVSEKLGLSVDDAARLRIRLHEYHVALLTGQDPPVNEENDVGEKMRLATLDAIRPALEQLGKEVALCLRYCSVTFRGPRPESVMVVGGESLNADMLHALSEHVNVPFQLGKPMRHISIESEPDKAERRTGKPEWATVLGLAMKSVNQKMAVAS